MRRMMRFLMAATFVVAASGCMFGFGRQPAIIYVSFAPPTPPAEVIVVAPGPRYTWRPGYFMWDARHYVWVSGAWITIAPGYSEWIPGRWEHDRHGWYWVEGRWR